MFSVGKMKIRLFMIVGLFLLLFAGAPRHASADEGGIFFMVNPDNLVAPCNNVYMTTSFKPWYTDILDTVKNSAMSVGGGIYGKLVGGTKRFMAVLLGLWIALLGMKQVGSMTETDGLEFATKIGGICIKAAFIFILINQSTFNEYIWKPIVEDVPNEVGNPAAGGAEEALGNAIKAGEATKCISHIWGFDFSLGKWPTKETDPGFADPGVYMHGCFPTFFAFLLSIAIPIFLCDLYLRKGIVFAFCPLFVGAYLFPATKDFSRKGINSCLNIIFFQIVLYILLKIAGSILVKSAGLAKVSGSMDGGTIKGLVCSMRLFGSNDSEECAGAGAYSGNSLIVMLVMGFYCIYMLTLTDKFAEYFSDAQFGTTGATALSAVKSTGAAMNQGVGMAKGAAKMTGRFAGKAMDRAAARTVESARSGGKPGGFKAGLASFYLKQRGILNKDGSETKEYGAALANGRRRSIANFLSGGRLYKNEDYQNWAKHGPRDNAAASAADSAYQNRLNGKGNEPSSPSGSNPSGNQPNGNNNKPPEMKPIMVANKADAEKMQRMDEAERKQHVADSMRNVAANTDYSKLPNGEGQKQYDQMRIAQAQKEADYAKKVAVDPNYANSKAGMEEKQKLDASRSRMGTLKGAAAGADRERMNLVESKALSQGSISDSQKGFNAWKAQSHAISQAAASDGGYPGGEKQRSYDRGRADQTLAWSGYQAKVEANAGYKDSAEGKAELKQLQTADAALAADAKKYNLDTSRMDNAQKKADADAKMIDGMVQPDPTRGRVYAWNN